MFKKRRRRRRAKKTFVQRFFRSVISIVILTAFILGISLFVKEIAHLNPQKAADLSEPLLTRVGVSPEKAGEVAGAFVERMLKTNISPSENFKESIEGELLGEGSLQTQDEQINEDRELILRVAFISDAHNNGEKLRQALELIEETGAATVFFLGDYTDLGVLENLRNMRDIMEESSVIYYSLPGDRDLDINAEPANFENYFQVFGEPRESVIFADTKFVLLNNSANYTVISNEEVGQFAEELVDADFVLLSQPLYHPFESRLKPVMGRVEGSIVKDVKVQADELLAMIRDSDVKAVVAADHHSFSLHDDPVDPTLEHVVVGPVTDVRAEQSKTTVTFLSVYDDESYEVEEIPF